MGKQELRPEPTWWPRRGGRQIWWPHGLVHEPGSDPASKDPRWPQVGILGTDRKARQASLSSWRTLYSLREMRRPTDIWCLRSNCFLDPSQNLARHSRHGAAEQRLARQKSGFQCFREQGPRRRILGREVDEEDRLFHLGQGLAAWYELGGAREGNKWTTEWIRWFNTTKSSNVIETRLKGCTVFNNK